MLFRRIVLCALLVGALSGLLLSAVQRWQVVPLINIAERYERAALPVAEHAEHGAHSMPMPGAAHADHEHAADAWEPEDGIERTAYTVLANILTATGFALLMLVTLMAFYKRNVITRLDWRQGVVWGGIGYAIFFVAPSLGLPPEIPGAVAAPLEARQIWWVLAAGCTAAGLAIPALIKTPWRWAALGLLPVPHFLGAPHLDFGPFAGYPPEAAAELTELAGRFVWATAFANAALWFALGCTSVWAVRRFLKQALA